MMNLNKLKNTNIIWLPQIPEHWKLVKVRHLFSESTKKGFPNETLLVASQEHGVVSKDIYGKRTVEATKDLHNLKLVDKGDFVISLRSFQGGIELAHERGIISPAYTVLKATTLIDKRYFKNLFKSLPFISLMTLCVKGIREGQNIDYPTFKNEYLSVPPIKEQSAIAEYLDKKNSEIDRFIQHKERLIELLKEEKRLIILKNIQGKYISDNYNNYFEPIKLKYCCKIIDCKHITPSYSSDGIPIVSPGELKPYSIDYCGLRLVSLKDYKRLTDGDRMPMSGDILYSRNASVGAASLIKGDKQFCMGQDVCLIRSQKYSGNYLEHLLNSDFVLKEVERILIGTTIRRINISEIKELRIICPPIRLQKMVCETISKSTSKIDLAISKAQKEISSIKEYREALITDLVTGKRSIPQS
jgi:type I restriction enzyme S subunit